MSQDEDRRTLERRVKAGDKDAEKKLRALKARTLTAVDAEYFLAYLALCDEVSLPTGPRGAGDTHRTRPVENLEAELRDLNARFKERVSAPWVIRKSLAALDAFREGVEVASWSASEVGCNTNGSHGGDGFLFQYASRDGKKTGLPDRGSIRDEVEEHEGYREKYPSEELTDPFSREGYAQ